MILTDNGSEFFNPKCIKNGPDGKRFQRTKIYYCNPSAPYQKADIDLMMNHINSYRRKKLNGRSPYEAFCFYCGEELAQKLGCHEVDLTGK